MKSHCTKHGKVYEALCMECKGMDNPMCVQCLCEHNEAEHAKHNMHIEAFTRNELQKMQENLNNVSQFQSRINSSRIFFQEQMIRKNNLQYEFDEKLKMICNLLKEQDRAMHETDIKTVDMFIKGMNDLRATEGKVNNYEKANKEFIQKTKDFLASGEYWNALQEVKGSNTNYIDAWESELKAISANIENGVNEFENQLKCIEKILPCTQNPMDLLVPLKRENESLSQELKQLEHELEEKDKKIIALKAKYDELLIINKKQAEDIIKLQKEKEILDMTVQELKNPEMMKKMNDKKQSEELMQKNAKEWWYESVKKICNDLNENNENAKNIFFIGAVDIAATIIVLQVQCSTKIQVLDLGFNKMGPEGAEILGNALIKHCSLKILSLGATHKEVNFHYPKITGTEHKHTGKEYYGRDINWPYGGYASLLNNIKAKGAKAISEGLKQNSVLEELYLCFTGIDDEAVIELSAATKTLNTTLKILCIGHNPNVSDNSGKKYDFRSSLQVHGN